MRMAHIENGIVVNVIMSDKLIKGCVSSDTANIGDTYVNGTFVAPIVEHVASTQPDTHGFIQAIKAALGGIIGANVLAVSYPLFFVTVQSGKWDDVQSLIVDATAKGIVSADQQAAIKSAVLEFNIPITLE